MLGDKGVNKAPRGRVLAELFAFYYIYYFSVCERLSESLNSEGVMPVMRLKTLEKY